ncbi:MAG: FkbM family methyltransferase [Planctomycetes bacterium]|nr:FkbM family methyltransferase [Planctomycetota bacterium]
MLSERIRQLARNLVPKRAYLAAARAYGGWAAARRLGSGEFRRLKKVEASPTGGPLESFRVAGYSHPFFVRPGTTDANVLEDVILRDMYGCYSPGVPPRFIIDAGANAGFASAYFLNRFPQSRIVAIEPDSGNFAMVQENAAVYGERVRTVMAAVWPTSTNLRVQPSARADGITVVPVGAGEPFDCVGVDPLTLLRDCGAERISIFKCDIEGGEEALFSQTPDGWLERIDAIMVEIHSPAAHAAVYAATSRHAFRSYRYRELHVFVR